MDKINLKQFQYQGDVDLLYQSYMVLLADYSALVQAVQPTDEQLIEAEERAKRVLKERKAELELGARMALERVKEDYDV